MNESTKLLLEGLTELDYLVGTAINKNRYLYENTGMTLSQLLLREADKESFLQKTTAAVEKIKAAAQAGVKEISGIATELEKTEPPMKNSAEAAKAAADELESRIPGDSFLSKLSSLNQNLLGALFGDKDDPIEDITKIVADGQAFQTMIGNVVFSVLKMLDGIEPSKIVDQAAEEAAEEQGTEAITDEQKKKYIENVKQELLTATIDEILTSEDNETLKTIRETTGFSEKDIDKAIKDSTKPAKWFSGLKSLAGSFGFGLGGDLPFSDFGLTLEGLKEDIMAVKLSSLESVAGGLQTTTADNKVLQTTASGLEDLGAAKDEYEELQQDSSPTGPGSPDTPAASAVEPSADTSTTSQPSDTKYLSIAQSANLNDPEGAAGKLQQLLAAGVEGQMFNWLMEHMTLNGILSEKAVRYTDVVSALEGHLPENEAEAVTAIKKLSDEMRVELGTEFEIVGIPDSAAEDLAALRNEIQGLRAWLNTLPDELRPAVEDNLSDKLAAAGADSQEVDAILKSDDLSSGDVEDIFEPEDLSFIDLIDDPENEVEPSDLGEPDQAAIDGAIEAIGTSSLPDDEKESLLSKVGSKASDFGKSLYQNLSIDDIGLLIQAAQGDEAAKKKALSALGQGAGKAALTQAGLSQEDADALVDIASKKKAGPGNPQKMSGKFSKGDSLPLNSYQEREDGEGWQAKAGKKTQSKRRQKRFKTEKGAKNHAMKEANVVVSRMRGFVLSETNDFRHASSLHATEVISEFYRLGGTNEKILSEIRNLRKDQNAYNERWAILAGFGEK